MILVTQHSPPRHDTTALTCTAFLRLFEVDFFLKILFVLCPLVAIIVMKDEPVTNARARARARARRARANIAGSNILFFFEETPCYKHRCPHDYNQPSAS